MKEINTIRKILQGSPPSSLRHYTSFDTLNKIFKIDASKDEELLFWFSNPMQTNDPKEMKFFNDSLYRGSKRDSIKDSLEMVQKKTGHPFTLSLSHHLNVPANYQFCEIPMWDMYGDKFKGVRLRFRFKELKDYCKSCKYIDLVQCKYLTKTEMDEITKSIRHSINDNQVELEKIYKEAVVYKGCGWLYENEWRLVSWSNNDDMIDSKADGRLYLPVKLPMRLLDAIEIGPKADFSAITGALELIKRKFLSKGINADFDIIESKLKIGYV